MAISKSLQTVLLSDFARLHGYQVALETKRVKLGTVILTPTTMKSTSSLMKVLVQESLRRHCKAAAAVKMVPDAVYLS